MSSNDLLLWWEQNQITRLPVLTMPVGVIATRGFSELIETAAVPGRTVAIVSNVGGAEAHRRRVHLSPLGRCGSYPQVLTIALRSTGMLAMSEPCGVPCGPCRRTAELSSGNAAIDEAGPIPDFL